MITTTEIVTDIENILHCYTILKVYISNLAQNKNINEPSIGK